MTSLDRLLMVRVFLNRCFQTLLSKNRFQKPFSKTVFKNHFHRDSIGTPRSPAFAPFFVGFLEVPITVGILPSTEPIFTLTPQTWLSQLKLMFRRVFPFKLCGVCGLQGLYFVVSGFSICVVCSVFGLQAAGLRFVMLSLQSSMMCFIK